MRFWSHTVRALAVLVAMLAAATFPAPASAGWINEPDLTSSGLASATQVAATSHAGEPWAAYRTTGDDIVVRRFTSGAWVTVGGTIAAGNALHLGDIYSNGTDVYVSYSEADNTTDRSVYVSRWNGASWVLVGGAVSTASGLPIQAARVRTNGAEVAVEWHYNNSGHYVSTWNGATWTNLGFTPTSSYFVHDAGITYFGGNLVVANGTLGTPSTITVKQWDGATWTQLGSTFTASSEGIGPSPFVIGGTLYVTVADSYGALQLRRWDGANWVIETGVAHGAGRPLDVEVVAGVAHIAHAVGITGGSNYGVSTYDGTTWTALSGYLSPRVHADVVHDGTSTWVVSALDFWSETPAKFDRWEASATSSASIVPGSDRPGLDTWTNQAGGTSNLFDSINDGVDAIGSSYVRSNPSPPVTNFASFELTDTAHDYATVSSLVVRTKAHKTGSRASTLTVTLRRADGTPVGTAATHILTTTATIHSWSASSLALTWSDVTGLYIDVTGSISGGGAGSTEIVLDEIQVDLSYTPIPTTSAPDVPTLVAPANGVNVGTNMPTFQATFSDADVGEDGVVHVRYRRGSDIWSYVTSPVTANGATASLQPSSPLLSGTYTWQAIAQDASGVYSQWSSTRTFTVTTANITVSGNAYHDGQSLVWTGCDGVTANVAIVVNGASKQTTTCDATTGAFSFASVTIMGLDQSIAVWLDTGGGDQGVTYVRNANASSSIASVELRRGFVSIHNLSTTAFTNAAINSYDASQDSDIPVASNGTDMVANANLLLYGTSRYTPGGDVTAYRYWARSGSTPVYTGSGETLTLTQGGNGGCDTGPAAPPYCHESGTFNAGGNTVVVTAMANGMIRGSVTFATLRLEPSAGTPSYWFMGDKTIATFLVGGSNGVNMSQNSTTVTVTGTMTVNAGSTYVGSGNLTVNGDFTGAGTVAMSAGTTELRAAGASTSFGTTTGAADWTFHDLTMSNSTASARTTTLATGGTGALRVGGTLRIGKAGDTGSTSLDANANDRSIDANGDVLVLASGALHAPPTASFTLAGDLDVAGSYVHHGGTLEVDGSGTTSLTYAAATTFEDVSVSTASKSVAFDETDRTNIAGTLAVDGGSCSTPVALLSTTPGNAFEIDVQGAASVTNASITDSIAVTARSASATVDGGGNTGWTISGCTGTTVSVDAATIALGPIMPGQDAVGTSIVTVTTTSPGGYELRATDTSDTTMATCGCGGSVPDWTGTDATPTVWGAGSAGFGGLTVRDATGGRIPKWGPGTGTSETDFVDNLYVGLDSTSDVLLHQAGAPSAGDTITTTYRVNAGLATPPGAYSATVTYTATGLP